MNITQQAFLDSSIKTGEKYAGILLGKNGEPDQHIILLPGEVDSQDSTCAWLKYFYGGNQCYDSKLQKLRARAVRRLPVLSLIALKFYAESLCADAPLFD